MIAHIYFSHIGLNEHKDCVLEGVGEMVVVFLPVSHLMIGYKAKPSSYWLHSFLAHTFTDWTRHIDATSCALTGFTLFLLLFLATLLKVLSPRSHFVMDTAHSSNSQTT
jgi:hypothetical protein